jgi:hypothetical protein
MTVRRTSFKELFLGVMTHATLATLEAEIRRISEFKASSGK